MRSKPVPGALAVGGLLERALGGPVALLTFDSKGVLTATTGDARTVAPELAPGYTLSPHVRAELAGGRRRTLSAEGGRWAALAAEDEAGLLWVALVREEPQLDLPRFAQHLVHALRNSLSSVKLAAQTLSRAGELPLREKRRVTIAVREIGRMERLLSTASEYARPPTRAAERVDVSAALRTAVAATQNELGARGVELNLQLEAVPAIQGDAQRLQLCFENLLTFGARSMPEGGELDLSLTRDGETPLLTFRDHGIELSAEDRAALFVPLGGGSRGSGLDLPLLALAARELGGAVEAEPAEPGLRLRIWLGPRGEGAHGHAALGR